MRKRLAIGSGTHRILSHPTEISRKFLSGRLMGYTPGRQDKEQIMKFAYQINK